MGSDLKQEILQRENTRAFCDSDKRVHQLRRYKKTSLIANQQAEIDEFNAQKERGLNRQKQEERQAQIAAAIQSKNQQIAREESLKKRVCAGSDELKNSKKQLNAAYLNLDLEKQMHQKELETVDAAKHNEKLKEEIAALNAIHDAKQKQVEEEKKLKLMESKEIIEKQLREKELAKQQEYLEFLREKEEIDKILKKIQNDKNVKMEKEFLKREETKKFVENYLIEREQHRAKQLQAEKAENAKISAWNKVQEERTEAIEAKKKAKQECDRLKYEAVKDEMEEKQKEMDFMQDLINELSMEENQLKILEKERKEYEKKMRLKDEMKRENMLQIKRKAERASKEKENELKLRDDLMARYANDAKMEQLSAHKKRLAMIQYKKDVQDIINERKRLKEMEEAAEAELDKRASMDEKVRADIIQKEMLRLIQEHAPKLKHFLNTKLATNQEELDIITQYMQ